jgi:D-glycero-D-manno-heptose 1,7-bisphosphate phosphatase
MSELAHRVRRGCPESPREARSPHDWPRPIAFLDRDGVLNADRGYVHRVEEFHWIPGAIEAVRLLNHRGYIVAVVTNQSGIGRGLYTEEEFIFLTLWMVSDAERQGARIDVVYYCPHHPEAAEEQYLAACPARKPGVAMLERAAQEFDMDRGRSFLIGNRESDVQAAQTFGIKGVLFEEGDLVALVRSTIES